MAMTQNDLRIFAYHVSTIMHDKAPSRFGLSCGPCSGPGLHVKVTIEPSGLSATNGAIWDSVTIDGQHCGNRHGGVTVYTRLVAEAFGLKEGD